MIRSSLLGLVRHFARGLDFVEDKSCTVDVDDELLPELVDTISPKIITVLIRYRPIVLEFI